MNSFVYIGTAFPIEIDRRDITFEGENNVILILTSASGQRQTVRITLQRFQQSFSVRCRAAQTADLRNIELSCTETDSSGQTIDTIRYAINGVFALETGTEQQYYKTTYGGIIRESFLLCIILCILLSA